MFVPDGFAMPGAKAFPTIESLLGPQLIGCLLSTAYLSILVLHVNSANFPRRLWGVILVQIYDYFTVPNQDHLRQKLVVSSLFLSVGDSQETDVVGCSTPVRFIFVCKRIVFILNSFLDTVDSLLVIHPLYFLLVKNYTNTAYFLITPW